MRTNLTENAVGRVHGYLILGRIADQTFSVGESDVRRRRSIALVVGDDLHFAVLKHADTRVRRAQINTDSWCFLRHFFCSIAVQYFNELNIWTQQRLTYFSLYLD